MTAALRGPLAKQIDIDRLGLVWSNPQSIGDGQWGSVASPTPAFWDVWRENKSALQSASIICKKFGQTWLVAKLEKAPQRAKTDIAVSDEPLPMSERALALGFQRYPYQNAGIRMGLHKGNVLIADDMGLGKSNQAVGIIDFSGAKNALIIVPASLKLNWEREVKLWLTRSMSVAVIKNGRQKWPSAQIVIINYDIVHKYDAEIKAIEWDVLVADECHALRNNRKTRFGAHIFGHRNKGTKPIRAKRKVFLTGTPIVNRPGELWPLISYLDPAYWSSPLTFAREFCDAPPGKVIMKGASNLDQLQAALRETVMVRRLKADVLKDLPPKTRQLLTMPSTGSEREIAAEMETYASCKDKVSQLRAKFEISKASAVDGDYKAAIHRLREGVGEAFAAMARARKAVAIAKLPSIIDHLDEQVENGQKVIVFVHHREIHEALMQHFADRAVGIIGGTGMTARQAAVDKFQGDDKIRVFVGSILAAGTGLTLTASNHVVMAELDWAPSNIVQAEDRAHRIGQKDNVLSQWIVLDGSLDSRIAQVLMDKAAIIEQALDRQPGEEITTTERQELNLKMELLVGSDIATKGVSRDQLAVEAERFSASDADVVLDALRGLQADSPVDAKVIAELSGLEYLTERQAALGLRLVRKYGTTAEVEEIGNRIEA